MTRFSLSCLTLLALLTAAPAAAQEVLPITGIADVDRYDTIVQLGAHTAYAGLRVIPEEGDAEPKRLLIFLPPVQADSLCVELISHDGRYRGRFRFPRPDAQGWRFLELPTREEAKLRQYGTHRLAPLAHLAGKCDSARGVSVPAGWGPRRADLRLRLLVNPENVDWLFVNWRGERREFPCRRIRDTPRVAYVYACDVGSPAAYGIQELRIQQMNGGTPLPPIYVPIWVPHGL